MEANEATLQVAKKSIIVIQYCDKFVKRIAQNLLRASIFWSDHLRHVVMISTMISVAQALAFMLKVSAWSAFIFFLILFFFLLSFFFLSSICLCD